MAVSVSWIIRYTYNEYSKKTEACQEVDITEDELALFLFSRTQSRCIILLVNKVKREQLLR
jgi:hypothetical protein